MTTAERRKAIPLKVKLVVLIDQARCATCGEKLGALDDTEFDHRPPLVLRPWNEAMQDFEPPQNDPAYLSAVHSDCHLALTTGRRGEKRVNSRDGDIGTAAHVKRLEREHEDFRRRILLKQPGEREEALEKAADTILKRNGFHTDGRRKPWPKRKLTSRNTLRKP